MKRYVIAVCLSMVCCSKPAQPPPPPISVSVAEAIKCSVPRYYDYIGHVIPLNTVKIVPQVQGYLTKIYFQEGQDVKAGDLLATIDDRPYKATLAKAEATLAQTVVALKYSEDTVNRYAKLVPQDFVSQLNFDKYVSDVLSDEAIVKQNLAEIEKAKLDLSYTYMHANVDGVVGVRLIDEGNFIPSGSTDPIVILNQLQPITVEFFVPEEDLSCIRKAKEKIDLKTRIFLEGEETDFEDGLLTLINNQVDQKTGSILLRARFPNEDKAMWPGQYVTVRLYLEEMPNSILIPSQAVMESQNGPYVYIIKPDKTAEFRYIKRGMRQGDLIIIEQGIAKGEKVVLEGQLNLFPGVSVAIHNEKTVVPTFNQSTRP